MSYDFPQVFCNGQRVTKGDFKVDAPDGRYYGSRLYYLEDPNNSSISCSIELSKTFPVSYKISEDYPLLEFNDISEIRYWADKMFAWAKEVFSWSNDKFDLDEQLNHRYNADEMDSLFQHKPSRYRIKTFEHFFNIRFLFEKTNLKDNQLELFLIYELLMCFATKKEVILYPESIRAKKLREEAVFSKPVAAKLLSYFLDEEQHITFNSINDFEALSVYINFKRQVNKKNQEKIEAHLGEILNDYETDFGALLEQIQNEQSELRKSAKDIETNFLSDTEEAKTTFVDHSKVLLEKYEDSYSKCEQKLKDLEETYNSKLSLAAPSEYWNNKCNYHFYRSIIWLVVLLISGSIGFFYLHRQALIMNQAEIRVYFTVISFIMIALPILWILRIVSKIFMHHFNVYGQADEKRVQIRTFLALVHDNKLNEKDIHLILQSIFGSLPVSQTDDAYPKHLMEHFINIKR